MAEIRRQCRAVVSDKIGRLAEVTDHIKEAGVNILAMCAWVEQGRGHILVVGSEPEKCCSALSKVVDKCEWDEVVCAKVANKIGVLNTVAHKLAEADLQVNMATDSCAETEEAMVVLQTSNNAKAAEIL